MENTRLIKLLALIGEKEWRLLEDFVRSPAHNKHREVIDLFLYLKKHFSKKGTQLKKESVYQHLYGTASYEAQKLHYVASYLSKVIEDFLSWREWKTSKATTDRYLLQAYNKRRAANNFQKVFNQISKVQEKSSIRNLDYYEAQYLLAYEAYRFSENLGRKEKINPHGLADAFDHYYCIQRLRIACFQLSHQAIFTSDFNLGLLEEVLKYIEEKNLLTIPPIAIYYYAYQTLANPEEEVYFGQFRTLIKEKESCFEVTDLKEIYLFAINYCIRRINTNDAKYIREVFELYKLGLNNGVFLENNHLSHWTYNNIIISGLKLKAFDWVEKFIYEYKDYLLEKHQEGSFNFNLAKFYFEKGDYQSAMPLLQKMEYTDIFHNIVAKITLAKMYYELTEFDALDNLLNAMKVYIQRQKMVGYHKQNYRNIIRFFKKLTYLDPNDPSKKQKLKEQIEETKGLSEKQWFLEILKG